MHLVTEAKKEGPWWLGDTRVALPTVGQAMLVKTIEIQIANYSRNLENDKDFITTKFSPLAQLH